MISQFFVLSQRGDNIVFRDCKFAISSLFVFPEQIYCFFLLLSVVNGCDFDAVKTREFHSID